MRRLFPLLIVIGLNALLVDSAFAQIMHYPQQVPSMTSSAPNPATKNYTDYYMNNLQRYHRPQANVRDYTLDKYYLRNQNLSPYLNLGRVNSPNVLNNYYRYVRPELDRRSHLNPMGAPGVVGLVNKAPPSASAAVPTNYPISGVPNRSPVNPILPNRPDALAPKPSTYYKQLYKK